MNISRAIAPSPWLLGSMIDRAMAACDADVEQARLAEEARKERRAERIAVAQARAQAQARTLAYWSR